MSHFESCYYPDSPCAPSARGFEAVSKVIMFFQKLTI